MPRNFALGLLHLLSHHMTCKFPLLSLVSSFTAYLMTRQVSHMTLASSTLGPWSLWTFSIPNLRLVLFHSGLPPLWPSSTHGPWTLWTLSIPNLRLVRFHS